ncbi:hypothetical protein SRHO_G00005730 [Serrasalmus rhombeus]
MRFLKEQISGESLPRWELNSLLCLITLETGAAGKSCPTGEEKLQCLNQYKMDMFYREARAALTTTSTDSSPSHLDKESQPATGEGQTHARVLRQLFPGGRKKSSIT